MKAFWAKITAFFMAILAFFTGLFSGGSKPVDPQPEPTTEVIVVTTEPTTEPTLTTVGQYDLPALPGAAEPGVYQSSGSTEIVR